MTKHFPELSRATERKSATARASRADCLSVPSAKLITEAWNMCPGPSHMARRTKGESDYHMGSRSAVISMN